VTVPIVPGPDQPQYLQPVPPPVYYYQQPAPPPRKKGLSTGAILGIVFGGITVVGVVVLFFCMFGAFAITRGSHAGDSDVTIEGCHSTSGGLATADLLVRNSASINASYIITVEFIQGSTRVGQDKEYVNGLRPGQSARATATAIVSADGSFQCQVTDVARI
jgi:hypothetical protein